MDEATTEIYTYLHTLSLPDALPIFQGQTKEKLVTVAATKLVETSIKDHCDHWLSGHPERARLLLERVLERADERQRRRQEKEQSRKTATRQPRLPGKLSACSRRSRSEAPRGGKGGVGTGRSRWCL